MIEVKIKDDTPESFNKALSIFKKKCSKDGFIKELMDRKYYKKPSEKKKLKSINARKQKGSF
jgi:small subunit ribosomal protein S21